MVYEFIVMYLTIKIKKVIINHPVVIIIAIKIQMMNYSERQNIVYRFILLPCIVKI